jgi:hypothetical protein
MTVWDQEDGRFVGTSYQSVTCEKITILGTTSAADVDADGWSMPRGENYNISAAMDHTIEYTITESQSRSTTSSIGASVGAGGEGTNLPERYPLAKMIDLA